MVNSKFKVGIALPYTIFSRMPQASMPQRASIVTTFCYISHMAKVKP